MGAGATRRILLSDTILDKYTPAEIALIIAHEMGHQRHRDMPRLFVFQGVVLLFFFFLSGLLFQWLVQIYGFRDVADAAALPLLVIVVAMTGLAVTPLTASFTRWIESQADRFALDLTGDPDSFISAMSKLTDQNLAEGSPSRWAEVMTSDHPRLPPKGGHGAKVQGSTPPLKPLASPDRLLLRFPCYNRDIMSENIESRVRRFIRENDLTGSKLVLAVSGGSGFCLSFAYPVQPQN